ncbi:helix-turn-helix domain-containing protein [uncultured Marixanthomonas sp.]|uniref:AraC family transcriptional regulator n=1 Tax=uncultured Marixanthomonas sp. TaxID=757245 RepID=UPI0030D89C62|tara:strand:+ start:80348 stop:81529 length:1182 start_codon:yes stop_codon:yes gene_type:complete
MFPIIESYFSILMLFGASQALMGMFLLLKRKQKPFSNNLLALLLLAWGFSCYWFFAFIDEGPFFSVTVTTFIGPMLALTLFPPVFLYAKYLFYEYKSFQKIDHLHFIPIYLYTGFTLYLYFDSNFSISNMRQHEWYHLREVVCSYLATFLGPFYFIKTNQILKLRQQMLKEEYSEIESRKLEGFQIINYSFALVFIIGGISTIVENTYINPYILYMAYHAVLAVSIFYITLMIYKYPIVFNRVKKTSEVFNKRASQAKKIDKNSFLRNVQILDENDSTKEELIITKIEKVMRDQKLYKNQNFSLNNLAEAISESRNAISHALNNRLNKTFYNYINELRIEESKRLLSDKSLLHFTIEGIATESGFKTISVFYRFFKDVEKVTPAVYRKSVVNS